MMGMQSAALRVICGQRLQTAATWCQSRQRNSDKTSQNRALKSSFFSLLFSLLASYMDKAEVSGGGSNLSKMIFWAWLNGFNYYRYTHRF